MGRRKITLRKRRSGLWIKGSTTTIGFGGIHDIGAIEWIGDVAHDKTGINS